MPSYKYRVRDKHGRAVTGLMGAPSEKEVVDSLKKMGYTPISIEVQKGKKDILKIELFNKVKDEDRALFSRQMHTLLKAGVPLLAALDAVGMQANSRTLKNCIDNMKAEVESGTSFSEALSRYPKIFPLTWRTQDGEGICGCLWKNQSPVRKQNSSVKGYCSTMDLTLRYFQNRGRARGLVHSSEFHLESTEKQA